MNRAQRVIACLFLLSLILLAACSRTAPGSPDLAVNSIEPSRGSLLGATEVTIRGEGLFQALSGAYPSDLSVSVCGAPLTDLQLIEPEEKVSVLPGGGVSKLLVGSSVKGVTSAMTDSSGDIVVTRPDGQSLTLEGAFDCYPPAPVAAADTFDVLGNVNIEPPAADGLLANDSGYEIQVVSFGANAGDTPVGSVGKSNQGGDVTVAVDGSFTYDPPPGFTGSDSFSYRISNDFGSVDATVSLTIDGMIWFVDNGAASTGDGRLSAPFDSLATLVTGAGPSVDTIFLFESAAPYVGPLILADGQRVIGQDATNSLATLAEVAAPPHAQLPQMKPGGELTTLAGDPHAVQLSRNNQVHGLTISSAAGKGIVGGNFGLLTIRDVTIDVSDTALLVNAGEANVVLDSTSSSGGQSNVIFSEVSGSLDLGTGSLSGSTGTSFIAIRSSATVDYQGTLTNDTSRSVEIVSSDGGITLAGNIHDTGEGIAIVESTVTLSGSSKTLHTGSKDALVSIDSNLYLTNGGLDIETAAANWGFVAVAQGAHSSLVVAGSDNRIHATDGGAIILVGPTSTPDASLDLDVTFADLTSSYGTPETSGSGIIFIETDGSFTVTGTTTLINSSLYEGNNRAVTDFGNIQHGP